MRRFATLLFMTSSIALASCAQAGPNGSMTKQDVEKIVHEYLLENPEIIREALIALQEKEELASIDAVRDQILNDPRDVVIGPDDAKVTIVEFFDYNCGFCKRSTEWLQAAVEEHPDDIRVIFKEMPLLDGRTKTSRNAARAALAAHRQGKYWEMHVALMTERSLTAERVAKIAEKLGLDKEQMAKDMQDPELDKLIEDTLVLGNRIIPLTGTPFFMINDQYLAGADTLKLRKMLAEELAS